ncbi:Bromodomain and PHD finger-containing protein 3 [Linum perenne]
MDFATVRKKLGNGSYCTLEQFESDVFLICTNAMKYNSSDTIYHKQARAIQELATKKFEKMRVAIERSEKEQKSEQKTKSNILAKKQMKKPSNRTIQDTVGSDFSSGATLANAGQVQNGSSGALTGACERSGNVETLVENSLSLADNLMEKVEELSSGKGPLFKMGKKPSVPDDYRRATYSPCSQPVERPDTIFTTFEDELRHLIAVGLHAEYFYTRSMARFAANLGPVAWKVASKRIEQALPPGCKFGRGWVGEYEPLTAPIIMFERAAPKYDVLLPKVKASVDGEKGDVTEAREHPARKNVSEGKQSVFRPTSVLASEVNNSSPTGTKPIAPVKITHLQQTSLPRNYVDTRDKTSKQVELNLPPSIYRNDEIVGEKQMSISSEIAASKVREVARSEGLKPREMLRTEGIIQPTASKQLDNNGNSPQGLPEGKTTSSFVSRPVIGSCNGFNKMAQVGTNQMVRGVAYFPGVQGQVLTDPVEAMRKSAEMVRNQQKPSSQSSAETTPASTASSRSDSSNNAAVAAARAWMSVGAGGFKPSSESCTNPISAEYNPAWQLAPQFPRVQGQFPVTASAGVQLESEKNKFPFQAFMRPPFLGGGEAQLQGRPVVFPPQLVGASDMSRYGMMTPWRGGGQSQQQHQFQQKQRQDTLPPDLNIGFQSPGSPAKQSSSGVMVDSQQPDLALQL